MSQVPELIDALVGLFTGDEDLTGVQVTDGPQVTDSAAREWLMVGYDGDDTFQAATTEQNWAGMSTRRSERISLTLALVAGRGDTDVKAARDRVYAMADVVEARLQTAPGVGLASLQLAVASSVLQQPQTQSGVQARLILTLAADTFT